MSDDITIERVMQDFERAWLGKKAWLKAAETDYEVRMGKQWDPADVEKLKEDGRPALTINHIHPMINLLYGIESQNRTDPHAFPEGLEDDVKGEIATRLMKNMAKRDWVPYKISEQFEHGCTVGDSFLEPWLDYTKDLLFGQYRTKRLDYNQCFPDPNAREYDLSDAEYFDKITYCLTQDQLVSLYPDKEKEIKEALSGSGGSSTGAGRIHFENIGAGVGKSTDGPGQDYVDSLFWAGPETTKQAVGDLLEHYYKKYMPVYYVIDLKLLRVEKTSDKDEADRYKDMWGREVAEKGATGTGPGGREWVRIEKRMVPEIWACAVLGGEILEDKRAWFYPRWENFHFIPFFCYKLDVPVAQDDRALLLQGFVRQLKDPQFERNKRESQLLHHLNTSIGGSAVEYEEGQLVNEKEVKEHGAAAGAHIVRKKGTPPIIRHHPAQLSTGHLVLSDRNADHIKTVSGMNPDLLAMQDGGQASGRAIALRQKQGFLMVQKPFDHLGRTKSIEARFRLSQLGEVYDLGRAKRVLGQAFLSQHFSKPDVVTVEDGKGGTAQVQKTGPRGEPLFVLDQQMADATINQVLNDAGLADYDVAVGESAMSETVQMANYFTILEMQERGIPVPPDVIVGESGLSASAKKKIQAYIESQQAAAAAAARGGGDAGGKK